MNLSGSPLDFLWAFFGGVLVSFTPCVYPLLPITAAFIGASSSGSKIKGLCLSLVYVTGVSITYSILGLIAVLTGSIFGQFSTQPLVRIIAGLIIVLFGFIIWRGGSLRLPGLKLPAARKPHNYLSCFILGLTSGLLISPCILPVLSSILIIVATKQNLIYGALLLFSFAYGMGVLIILIGTFSSILTFLPKSGYWMDIIKKACAVILVAMGIYFIIAGAANLAFAEESENIAASHDFSLKDIDGNTIRLSEFRNKNSVILFFWTTWCPYCIRELRRLNEIYPDLIKEDIEILAINVQERESKVRRFLRRNPVDFKVLLDSYADVAYLYGVIGIPKFVFIDKEGQIVDY